LTRTGSVQRWGDPNKVNSQARTHAQVSCPAWFRCGLAVL